MKSFDAANTSGGDGANSCSISNNYC